MLQLRAALRSLLRQPSFLATAVGALALGIAAPTALFAVVQATLLRPLPYANAADIYTVRTTMTDGRFTIGLVASEELASLRRATNLVTHSALVFRADDSLGGDGSDARQIITVGVSEGFFELFGVPMAMGRAFTVEDHKSRTVLAAVLSSRAWRTLFSADPMIRRQDDSARERCFRPDRRRCAGAFRRAARHRPVVGRPVAGKHRPFVRRIRAAETGDATHGRSSLARSDVGGAGHEVSRPGKEPHLRLPAVVVVDRWRPRTDRTDRVRGHRVAVAAGDGQRRESAPGAGGGSRP